MPISIQSIKLYLELMRFHRPIGIFLLLFPTLWALWIAANGVPPIPILLIFISGVVVMRAAGCVINDWADQKWDGFVTRTQNRPLASYALSRRDALTLFIGLCAVAFGLVLMLNRFTQMLSLAALALAIIYPFMKRVTHLPQFFLGLAFSWSIPMAFGAVLNRVPPIAWLIFSINVLWTILYDAEYALCDWKDDITVGIKSIAVLFQHRTVDAILILQISVIMLLSWLGFYLQAGFMYGGSIAVAALLFCYQQWIIRQKNSPHYLVAFKNNAWVGFAVFIGILSVYHS